MTEILPPIRICVTADPRQANPSANRRADFPVRLLDRTSPPIPARGLAFCPGPSASRHLSRPFRAPDDLISSTRGIGRLDSLSPGLSSRSPVGTLSFRRRPNPETPPQMVWPFVIASQPMRPLPTRPHPTQPARPTPTRASPPNQRVPNGDPLVPANSQHGGPPPFVWAFVIGSQPVRPNPTRASQPNPRVPTQPARPSHPACPQPNPCVPNGDREDSLGLSNAMPQDTDYLIQGALKGRESHTIHAAAQPTAKSLSVLSRPIRFRAPLAPLQGACDLTSLPRGIGRLDSLSPGLSSRSPVGTLSFLRIPKTEDRRHWSGHL